MQTQVINQILETEKQASHIVENAKVQADQIVSDAQTAAARQYSDAVAKARDTYQAVLTRKETELNDKLKALEDQEVKSGADAGTVEEISAKIVEYVANTVIE